MEQIRRLAFPLALFVAIAIYAAAIWSAWGRRPPSTAPELAARLPLAAQVLLAGGDRHLAANMLGIRVLVADTFRMKPDEFLVQAQLQKDISWLNPAHEDNYYVAAAILSEPYLIPAAQQILRRAADARPHDWTPLFYYAFNLYQFDKNPAAAAQALLEGAARATDVGDQWGLQDLAARWIERGYRTNEAVRIVGNMADSAPPGGFKRYMKVRVERLRSLDALKQAASVFAEQKGRPLATLDELVDARLIDNLPADPLGVGFAVDASGEPVFRDRLKRGGR